MPPAVTMEGQGLHSGAPTQVTITRQSEGCGVSFVTPQGEIVPCAENIDPLSRRATDLISGKKRVRTVEHLMAALCFYAPDARVQVDGEEIPILDGSAAPWVRALEQWGPPKKGPRFFRLKEPLQLQLGPSHALLNPVTGTETPRYEVILDYPNQAIGPPQCQFNPTENSFGERLSPARTFALASEVPHILKQGLGAGGSLDNALILGSTEPLNPEGMRFPNEPARHKMLDALGDLFLLGALPMAHVRLFRPGHTLMHQVVQAIRKIETGPFSEATDCVEARETN